MSGKDAKPNETANPINKLIERLATHSPSNILLALNQIKNICTNHPGIKEFSDYGGILPLLDLIEKPKFADISLSILANCCLYEEARNQVLMCQGIIPIVRVFKCLASESIQNRACRALANLALSSKAIKLLHKEGIAEIIVKFLAATKRPDSIQTAVRAIRLLSCGTLYRTKFIEHEGAFHVSRLLNSEKLDVLVACVKTLAVITEHCSIECAQQIHRSQCLSKIIEFCNRDNEIQENAFVIIINLSSQSLIRPELGNAGVVPLLIKTIENNEPKIPALASIVTALCYCCREAINRVRIRDADGLKTLLTILKQENHPRNLEEKVICSLLAFRFDEASLDVLIELGLVDVLIKHLNHYIEDNEKEHHLKSDTTTETESVNKRDPETIPDEFSGSENELERCSDKKKKFCIHSPSYQQVQDEIGITRTHAESYSVSSDFPGPFNLFTEDKSSEPSSPNPWSCWSPSTSSDWSPIWSGSRCSSPGSSSLEEPTSPDQTSSSGYFSPVCGDFSGSEDDAGFKNARQDMPKEQPKKNFIRRTKRRASEPCRQSPQSPSSDESRPVNTTTSSVTFPKRLKYIPKEPKEDETLGGHIIHLLSHISQMEKHSAFLITESCIKTIMDYMCKLPTPSLRAERILIRLIKNYSCFESLISFGMITLIEKHLVTKHSPDICNSCWKLGSSKRRLLSNLSLVAESGYGIGVLSHILHTGQTNEIATCILAVPHLVKGHYQLRKLLCDCGGFSHLLQLLEGKRSLEAVEGLSSLCKTFFTAYKSSLCPNMKNDPSASNGCTYRDSESNVLFLLDDGSAVLANRRLLSQKSSFFSAMFEGSFKESSLREIKLPEVSRDALDIILHHFYDCSFTCEKFKRLGIPVLLELVSLCDRFLLSDLSKVIEHCIISKLNPESVKYVYAQAISHECEALSKAVLKYVLTANMQSEQRHQCFQDLRNSQNVGDIFLGDVQKAITSFCNSKLTVDDVKKNSLSDNCGTNENSCDDYPCKLCSQK